MRQWFFILTGGFGLALTFVAVAAVLLDVPTVVAPAVTLAWAEGTALAGGAILGGVGYAGARRSGRRAAAAWSPPGDGFDGDGEAAAEIAFECPTCVRGYRAAAACAGGPFACRTCGAVFTVPTRAAERFATAA